MKLYFDLCPTDADIAHDDVAINYRIDTIAKRLGRPSPSKEMREHIIKRVRSHFNSVVFFCNHTGER